MAIFNSKKTRININQDKKVKQRRKETSNKWRVADVDEGDELPSSSSPHLQKLKFSL